MSTPTVPTGVKVLSVGELTRTIKGVLENGFINVWVSGEVTNCKHHHSGHVYLKLKDNQAVLNAVMYRAVAIRQRFDLSDGMEVIVRGRLMVYEPQGSYQLAVEEVQPKGIGAQELALRQLKEKLFRAGWFDAKRKKPLPRIPRSIALVCSPTGAAVRDLLEILGQRWPHARIWVCPAKVQGEGAAESISWYVRYLNHVHQNRLIRVDVMILGRGGGSSEDLWAFNEEIVAAAIFRSTIPVVSAVGHQIDWTIADMVADHRAETPSAAATAVVPDCGEVLHWLDGVGQRMRQSLINGLNDRQRRLDDLASRRVFKRPLETVRIHEQRLDDWAARLERSITQRVALGRERVEALAGQLESLSPLNVLARGYSLTRKAADRAVVRDASQVQVGERLVTTLAQGTILSRVEDAGPSLPETTDGSSAARMQP